MRPTPSFIQVVAAARDLVVTRVGEHVCRLEPRHSELAWHCDLDDGTPTDSDRDPASSVSWVCPDLRVSRSAGAVPLEVHRRGPQSDLGRGLAALGRLAGRSPGRPADSSSANRFVYTDPHGILDVPMRHRIENWPPAPHGHGEVQPAELWSVRVNGEGLVVNSVSWWDSAAALEHHIGLAIDLADRLAATR